MTDPSGSIEAHYDDLATAYASFTDAPIRARSEWPATRSLLPEVEDRRVLDAGCGPGVYSAWLADRGADVIGVDVSREMVRTARERAGDRAEFRRADLRDGLDLPDDSVDVVLSQLVISHLEELSPVLDEFARVLDDGILVATAHHPFHDFLVVRDGYPEPSAFNAGADDLDPEVTATRRPPDYHAVERFEIDWGGEVAPGAYYRRPLGSLVGTILDAGFVLTGIEEPLPDEAFAEEHPGTYEDLRERPPNALCLRAELTVGGVDA